MARKSPSDLAVLLLLIGTTRHYGWALFPDGAKALASKGLAAAALLCVLAVVVYAYRSRAVLLVALWWAWEELQVVLCSFLFMVDPWPIKPEQPMCSARVGFDIGAAGIMAVAMLAYMLSLTGHKTNAGRENE